MKNKQARKLLKETSFYIRWKVIVYSFFKISSMRFFLYAPLVMIGFVILIIITKMISCTIEDTTVNQISGTIVSVEERLSSTGDNKISTVHTILFIHENGTEELLESRDNYLQGKFDNMSIIQQLKKRQGQKVILKVSGKSKSFLFDYRNVLEIVE